MIKELKFVMGAVAKKEFLPAMSHFSIDVDKGGGFVCSYNGALALGSPIAFEIPCKPKAIDMVKAIGSCKETITMTMTPAGRLSIKSGKFKALVDCVQEETPHVQPEGHRVDFDGAEVLNALKVLEPFIGNDASRQWSNGVLLRGSSAFATNNVTLVEYWMGCTFPVVINLPRAAVTEMLRINEAPLYAQMNDNSISFHYNDRRWLRTQVLEVTWPDMSKIFDQNISENAIPIPEQLFEGLSTIKPFCDKMGRVYLRDGKISTVTKEAEGLKHGDYELDNFPFEGCYQITMLELLEGVAQTVDFTTFPKPCIFYGERLRGAIIGMRI